MPAPFAAFAPTVVRVWFGFQSQFRLIEARPAAILMAGGVIGVAYVAR
jgi:hypothetical protein